MKLEHYLTHTERIDSKWTKDLNVSIKYLKENMGKTFHDINISDALRNLSPMARKTKKKRQTKRLL